MKILAHIVAPLLLCILSSCSQAPAIQSVDGIPVNEAERQAIAQGDSSQAEQTVRKVRGWNQERKNLYTSLVAARKYNRNLKVYCTHLVQEIDVLKGRSHRTAAEKQTLLNDIEHQKSRADFASRQTEQALEKSERSRASLKSAGAGQEELKAYDQEIEQLMARKRELGQAVNGLVLQRKEISS